MIRYNTPGNWIHYDAMAIMERLTLAKAAVLSLSTIPYQRSWADELQIVQLKREIAGTSRIEGAEFTEQELESAMRKSPEQLMTRSQRQAAATVKAYKWIAGLPADHPVDDRMVREVHRLIITDADDDHCPPGMLRRQDENVTFGIPKHRGVEGGEECRRVFSGLCHAVQHKYRDHDPLIQALAFHYHFAAMHPFLDGNGRSARALEALMLRRTGLRDTLFIAMSNYYHEEKAGYLESLARARTQDHDLTSFINFGLRGIALQCDRLLQEIKKNISKALFRNVMYDLFNRLLTTRKRVIAQRQIDILKLLLESDRTLDEIISLTKLSYSSLLNPMKALFRDINYLIQLQAIDYTKLENEKYRFFVRLEWPTEITETEFFRRVKEMPKAKTYPFLS